MKKILFFLSACLVMAIQSCSSDQEPKVPENGVEESEISHMIVKFDNRVYETDVKTIGDSVIYLNEEYAEVYRAKISVNSNLAVMVSTDEEGVTYATYYDSEVELLRRNNIRRLSGENGEMGPQDDSTRGRSETAPVGTVIATAELYRNTGFGGKCVKGTVNTMTHTAISNLKDEDFNDKASSIKLFNLMNPNTDYQIWYKDLTDNKWKIGSFRGSAMLPVLICYRNTDFDGKALYCVANPAGSGTDHLDSNLKKLDFNDIISSFDFAIIERSKVDDGTYEIEKKIFPHN